MKHLLILLSVIVVVDIASAQQLTIDDCRRMAIEHNRTLKTATAQSSIANDNLKMYKANFLPKFSLSGNYLYSSGSSSYTMSGGYLPTFVPNPATGALEPNILMAGAGGTPMVGPDGTPVFKQYAYMPDTKFDFKIGSVFQAGIAAQQPIYMGGKIITSVRMAKIGQTMAELNVKKTEAEVIIRVDEAFFTCIKMEELVKSAVKYKEVVAEFYRQMNDAYESGMKNRNDMLKVQVRMNEAELQVRKAQNGLRLAMMNLCYHTGLPMQTDTLRLTDNFESNPEVSNRQTDISSRPEYIMLQQQIELKKRNVALTRSDFLPQIVAMASYNYMNGIQLNKSTLVNTPSFVGAVSVNIPLFHWGEGRRKVSAARHEVEIAHHQFEDLTDQMELELIQATNNYEEAVLEVALTVKSLTQAEENMTESGNRYTAGMETLADYLESQALWQKAQSDLIEARTGERLAYTKYLKAAGISQVNQ